MPSGHSSRVVLFFLMVFYEYLYNKSVQGNLQKVIIKVLQFFCFWVILNTLVSRLYFGAHSINQILMGTLWGLCIFSFSR